MNERLLKPAMETKDQLKCFKKYAIKSNLITTTIFIVSSYCMSEGCQTIHYIKFFHDKLLGVKPNKYSCRPEKKF